MSAQDAYKLFHGIRRALGKASLKNEERSEIFRYLNAIESSHKKLEHDRDEWQKCVAVLGRAMAGLAPQKPEDP